MTQTVGVYRTVGFDLAQLQVESKMRQFGGKDIGLRAARVSANQLIQSTATQEKYVIAIALRLDKQNCQGFIQLSSHIFTLWSL